MERERIQLSKQETTLKAQIKKTAKEGQVDAARMLARDLVRTRAHITRMYQMRTQMQSVSMQLTSMKTNEAMSQAMRSAVGMMSKVNKSMNLPAMQNIMMNFEMEHGKLEMTQEMMDDAISDAMGGADEELETDQVVNQVMDELGLEHSSKIGYASSTNAQPVAPNAQQQSVGDEQALEARFDELRR